MNPIPHLVDLINEAIYPVADCYYDHAPKNGASPPLVTMVINDEHIWDTLDGLEETANYNITVIIYALNGNQTTALTDLIRAKLNGYNTYPFGLIDPKGWSDEPLEHGRLARGLRYEVIYTEHKVFDDEFNTAFA